MEDLILFLAFRVLILLTSKEFIFIYPVDIIADSGFIKDSNVVFLHSLKFSSTVGWVCNFPLTLYTPWTSWGTESLTLKQEQRFKLPQLLYGKFYHTQGEGACHLGAMCFVTSVRHKNLLTWQAFPVFYYSRGRICCTFQEYWPSDLLGVQLVGLKFLQPCSSPWW